MTQKLSYYIETTKGSILFRTVSDCRVVDENCTENERRMIVIFATWWPVEIYLVAKMIFKGHLLLSATALTRFNTNTSHVFSSYCTIVALWLHCVIF